MGFVYLLHFDKRIGDLNNPRGQAQHYIGYAENVPARMKRHREGNGAKIMAFLAREGIGFTLVRVWIGDKDLEKRLKRQHNARRFCPICRREHGTQA